MGERVGILLAGLLPIKAFGSGRRAGKTGSSCDCVEAIKSMFLRQRRKMLSQKKTKKT